MKLMQMNETGVGVWDFNKQSFIRFCPCPNEKRVRIDVYDDLENYAVYPGTWEGNTFFPNTNNGPLLDWQIDLT